MTSRGFCILLTTEVVPKIFPNLNVVAHLDVPAGCCFLPAEAGYFVLGDAVMDRYSFICGKFRA